MLQERRAAYGKRIVTTLSSQLVPEFGEGFGTRNLNRMVSFVGAFPDIKIATTLSSQLSWSHFVAILSIDDVIRRT